MITKKTLGFTLVEIVVVLAIFGLITIVGADFLVQTFSNSNRITLQNETRENANRIMEEITVEIRKSSGGTFSDHALTLSYADGSSSVTYRLIAGGVLQKTINSSPAITTILTSGSVALLNCGSAATFCSDSGCDYGSNPGFSVTPATISPTNPATITLVVQQNPAKFSSPEFCAQYTLTDSATPRKY